MDRSPSTLRKIVALAAFAVSLFVAPGAWAALTEYDLHIIWLKGEGEGDKGNADVFEDCLLHRTDYLGYWKGEASIVEVGSYVVTRPNGALGDAGNIGPFIQSLISNNSIPSPAPYAEPIYAVMVDPNQTSCSLGGGTGGRNAVGSINGHKAGLILITTNPQSFWPARTPLGGETTLLEHEVAEVIDGMRGGYQCCGDCCCEGWCNNAASCSNFSGLQCPGAPATTFTGSSKCGSVNGFLVQTLSHQGVTTCNCPLTCDTTVSFACTGDKEVLHSPCKQDGDCCSGLSCQGWSYSGKPPYGGASCCKAAGSTCGDGTECCGGLSCTGGKCACVTAGAWCLNDGDCCSGLACDAMSNKCVTAPPPDAGTSSDGGPVSREAGGGPPPPDASYEPLDGNDGGNGDANGSSQPGGCACDVLGTRDATGGATFVAIAAAAAAAVGTRRRRRSR